MQGVFVDVFELARLRTGGCARARSTSAAAVSALSFAFHKVSWLFRVLVLSFNQIVAISGLDNLKSLESLDVIQLAAQRICDDVEQLGFNSIAEIGSGLDGLQTLRHLLMPSNALATRADIDALQKVLCLVSAVAADRFLRVCPNCSLWTCN